MLGDYVKETRSKRGLSQAELAKLADLSPSFICRIEKGDYKSVTIASLSKLSRALKVSVHEMSNLVLEKGPKDDLLKKTPYEIINELSLSLPAIVPVYADTESKQIIEYAFVPRELAIDGGREMKLIGIKSSDLEYGNIVHKGDIIICGKDMQPSPGDLCLKMEGEQMI
ncbi:MAG: helix-turn-helix transcriptional regulator, partial [Chloroflexi bacterium]|nr:helix-turn-helix transcriptional regulator [Chloroflexota bacterium]